ncbi:hypothetical protein BU15DRAFT_59713 [Melanogaster broomeanus]|nr:hypothetical protein BU15DRAFT_59713 [Melanogaster broomeanus]
MHTAATPPEYFPSEYSSPHPAPSEYKRLLMSTQNILEQVPPPSLREILSAYKSKGDGDRDMLISMLNAKSAEDQRMAAVASLHRTLLELSAVEAKNSTPVLPQHPLPSPYINSSKHNRHPSDMSNGHTSPHVSAPSSREPPRKRQRSSRSPTSSSHYDVRSSHTSSRDLPPSPYSSSRSDSEEYSPRSRASMAIGSLLSTGPGRDSVPEDYQNPPETTQNRLPCATTGVSV